MNAYFSNKKGYAALMSILLAMLAITLLVFGGSFFSKKSQSEVYQESSKQAEDMIVEMDEVNEIKRLEIEALSQ